MNKNLRKKENDKSDTTVKHSTEINYKGIGCEPIREEEVDKHIKMMKFKGEFYITDPAECLAYAYHLKNTAEEYAYNRFRDRATRDLSEEEIELYYDGDEALGERVEANYQNILIYYNQKAIDILRKLDWRLDDETDLWEDINLKGDWR